MNNYLVSILIPNHNRKSLKFFDRIIKDNYWIKNKDKFEIILSNDLSFNHKIKNESKIKEIFNYKRIQLDTSKLTDWSKSIIL